MLDTQRYLVKFKDRAVLEYNINTIAESIYSEIDRKGHYVTLLDFIIDH